MWKYVLQEELNIVTIYLKSVEIKWSQGTVLWPRPFWAPYWRGDLRLQAPVASSSYEGNMYVSYLHIPVEDCIANITTIFYRKISNAMCRIAHSICFKSQSFKASWLMYTMHFNGIDLEFQLSQWSAGNLLTLLHV